MNKKREIKWWEVSQSKDRKEAMTEEMNEIIDQCRWEMNLLRKTGFEIYRHFYRFEQDVRDFWEKYSE